ncbi:MAG: hypothetical protein JWO05_2617 [Gemmatimonadetes bacterium]|nr:hypothetical protein [Gemmatimonadota bacterium]
MGKEQAHGDGCARNSDGQRTLDVPAATPPIPCMTARLRLGTQGWNYDMWVGPFYPVGTRPADYLATYSRAFDTVEVDSTFYATPPSTHVQGWAKRTPPGFTFALKLPQEISHARKLRHAEAETDDFFTVARQLGDKLGPVLVQLGPDFTPDHLPALAQFLPRLPQDVRCAVEFRHRGWINDGILALLAEHHVALALTDARWIPRKQMLALAERPTADFTYVRWMGPDRTIVDYSRIQVDRSRELELWAEVLLRLTQVGVTVYGYVNNHFAGHSPSSVRELQGLMGQGAVDPAKLGEQMSLF